jgi:hypothetical protein
MHRVWQVVVAGLILVAVAVPQAQGQDSLAAEKEAVTLAEELAGLNDTLDRMALLLERSIALQGADFLLRRIELKERRLRPMESQLRTTQNEIRESHLSVENLEQMMAEQEQLIQQKIMEGGDPEDRSSRLMMEKFNRAIEMEKKQIEESERRVIELENEMARGRRDLANLDGQLEDFLEN